MELRVDSVKRLGIMVITLSLLSGCGKALEGLVRTGRPPKGVSDVVPFSGQSELKISPGQTTAVSADVSMRAHVTITDRPLNGGDISATASIGRHRSQE